jgi:hypothetical protein
MVTKKKKKKKADNMCSLNILIVKGGISSGMFAPWSKAGNMGETSLL